MIRFIITIFLLLPLAAEAIMPAAAEQSASLINFVSDTDEKVKIFGSYLDEFGDELERATHNLDEYYDWCCRDIKRGPENERSVNLFYSVEKGRTIVPDASSAALSDRGLANIQKSFQNLQHSFEVVVPIMSEANAYYESEAYKLDDFEEGREIHKRLHPALQQYKSDYLASAELILENLDGYSEVVLQAYLKQGDEVGFAYKAASLALTKLVLTARTGAKPTKQIMKETVQALIECKRVLMKADVMDKGMCATNRKDIKWGFFTYQDWILQDCVESGIGKRCNPARWWGLK